MSSDTGGERLQKVLSKAGVASRRASERLIVQGRVQVDGEVVTELGARVDPATAVIHVDGERVIVRDDLVYLALNKPKGVHTTMTDDRGRPCVGDLVRGQHRDTTGIFHVGRLDADTEGLLLLTNDGELAHRLMHPSYRVLKTYVAEVDGEIAKGSVRKGLSARLHEGVELDDGPVQVDGFKVLDVSRGQSMVELVLHEGRNRIVRRLLAEVGHPVRRLVRTDIAGVRIGNAKPGDVRDLTAKEIARLHAAVAL